MKIAASGEIWRTVPSRPEIMVSSEGRIMVTPYQAPMPHGGTRWYGGQPHFGCWSKDDQRFIYVYKGRTYKIHRLICEAFHGPQPDGKPLVMHLNENSSDNRAHNLAWGTQTENLSAPGVTEYQKARIGDHNPRRKGMLIRAQQLSEAPQE